MISFGLFFFLVKFKYFFDLSSCFFSSEFSKKSCALLNSVLVIAPASNAFFKSTFFCSKVLAIDKLVKKKTYEQCVYPNFHKNILTENICGVYVVSVYKLLDR